MLELTGIYFGLEKQNLPLEMKLTNLEHEIIKGLPDNFTLGNFNRPITTGFAVLAPDFKPINYAPVQNNPLFFCKDFSYPRV